MAQLKTFLPTILLISGIIVAVIGAIFLYPDLVATVQAKVLNILSGTMGTVMDRISTVAVTIGDIFLNVWFYILIVGIVIAIIGLVLLLQPILLKRRINNCLSKGMAYNVETKKCA